LKIYTQVKDKVLKLMLLSRITCLSVFLKTSPFIRNYYWSYFFQEL